MQPELIPTYGETIIDEAERLREMIEQILLLAQLRSRSAVANIELLEIAPVVAAAVERCRLLAERNAVSIETSIDAAVPAVRGNRAMLTRAVENLIVNAIRHGGAAGGSPSACGAKRRARPPSPSEDRGPGIVESDRDQLFPHRACRCPRRSGRTARGLGLSIVRQIAAEHHGSVTVERPAVGAAFTIHLPAAERDA